MSQSSQYEAELIRQVEAAFSDVPYPGDNKLVSDDCGECVEIATEFKGQDWRSLPLSLLRKQDVALRLLSPAAYLYFLPAFLTVSIQSFDEADILPEYIVYTLSPREDRKDLDEVVDRIKLFSPLQRRAITSFLVFLKTKVGEDHPLNDDIDTALVLLGPQLT